MSQNIHLDEMRAAHAKVQKYNNIPYEEEERRSEEIMKLVDIGEGGTTILAGVKIGAGSVVAKDIPEGVIAVGVPCRVLKKIEV